MGDLRMTFDDRGFIRSCANAERIFAEEMTTAVRTASLRGEAESKAIVRNKGRIDTSALINGIGQLPIRRSGRGVAGGWAASAEHSLVNEKGRRPGRPMPPVGALLPWMARHGIPAEAEFVVRRKIGRDGIPGIWFMRDGRAKVRPLFRREVAAATRRAIRRIAGGGR